MGTAFSLRPPSRRWGLAGHAIFLVFLLVVLVTTTYIRTILPLLQPDAGPVHHSPYKKESEGRRRQEEQGKEGNTLMSSSSSRPRFLVTMALLGSKKGHTSSSMTVERTVVQAWLGQAAQAGYELRVLGLVEHQGQCDPNLRGLPGFNCTRMPSRCLHPTHHVLTVDCVFEAALADARLRPCDLIIFSNADLFLSPTLFEAAHYASRYYLDGFTLVGQRVDVNFTIPRGVKAEKVVEQVVEVARSSGRTHQALGVDFFVVPPHAVPTSFPPYLVGRWRWDNALLYHFFSSHLPVLDVTAAVMAVHLGIHDFSTTSHLERAGGDYNDKLAVQTLGHAYNLGRIDNTPYVLIPPKSDDNTQEPFSIMPRETPFHNLQMAALRLSSQGGPQPQPHPHIMVVPVFFGQALQALNWACWAQTVSHPHFFFLTFDEVTHKALTRHGAASVFLSVESQDLPPYRMATSRRTASIPPSYRRLQAQVLAFLLQENYTVSTADVDLLWVQHPGTLLHDEECDITMMVSADGEMSGLPGSFMVAQSNMHGRAFMTGLAECLLYHSDDRSHLVYGGDKPPRVQPASDGECLAVLMELLPGLRLCRLVEGGVIQSYSTESTGDASAAFAMRPLPFAVRLADYNTFTRRAQNKMWLWDMKTKQCSRRKPLARPEEAGPWLLHILLLSQGDVEQISQTVWSLAEADYQEDTVLLTLLMWSPSPSIRPEAEDEGQIDHLEEWLEQEWQHGDSALLVDRESSSLLSAIQAFNLQDETSVVMIVEEGALVSPHFYKDMVAPGLQHYYYDIDQGGHWDPQLYGLVLTPPQPVLAHHPQPPGNNPDLSIPSLPPSHRLYRYQRADTSGVVIVGPIWSHFTHWIHQRQAAATAGTPRFCVPGFKPHQEDSVHDEAKEFFLAFTRFSFEMGLYGLHLNHPAQQGLVSVDPQHLASTRLHEVIHDPLSWPPLSTLPLYDYSLLPVPSPASLWARALILSSLEPSCTLDLKST